MWENVVHDTSFNKCLCTLIEFWDKYLSLLVKRNVDLGGSSMDVGNDFSRDTM
jgi:hypothetical protein